MSASCRPIECRDARLSIPDSSTAVMITSGRIRLPGTGLPAAEPEGGDDEAGDKLLDDDD